MRYGVICLKLFNTKIYRMKYFVHEIFTIYDIPIIKMNSIFLKFQCQIGVTRKSTFPCN